jgi:hypothetical protein
VTLAALGPRASCREPCCGAWRLRRLAPAALGACGAWRLAPVALSACVSLGAHGTRSQARALARKHTRQAHARKHASKSTSTPQVLPLTPRGPPDSRSNSNAYSLLSIALAPNYQSSNVSSLSVHPLTISVSVRPRARTHAHAHARAHIHTHTHIYTYTHTHLTVAFPSG